MNAIHFIYKAQEKDLKSLQDFLAENKLKSSIAINEYSLYYFIKNEEEIIGTIGAEFSQQYALIRAAGIANEWRRKGVAQKLFQKLESELKKRDISHLYLFSRQAGEFWTKMGFMQCTIQEVVDVLPDAPQVKEFLADNTIWTDVAWYKSVKYQ